MFRKPLHSTAHICRKIFPDYTTSLYDSVQISLISGHDGRGATPTVLAPKHGEEEVEELGKSNGNPTNTEGSPSGIPIPKVLHETRRPPVRRCKMGDPGRCHNRSQGAGHLRAEERRSSLVLVPDCRKYCRLEIFLWYTRELDQTSHPYDPQRNTCRPVERRVALFPS